MVTQAERGQNHKGLGHIKLLPVPPMQYSQAGGGSLVEAEQSEQQLH